MNWNLFRRKQREDCERIDAEIGEMERLTKAAPRRKKLDRAALQEAVRAIPLVEPRPPAGPVPPDEATIRGWVRQDVAQILKMSEIHGRPLTAVRLATEPKTPTRSQFLAALRAAPPDSAQPDEIVATSLKSAVEGVRALIVQVKEQITSVEKRLETQLRARDELRSVLCTPAETLEACRKHIDDLTRSAGQTVERVLRDLARMPMERRLKSGTFDYLVKPEVLLYLCRDVVELQIQALLASHPAGISEAERAQKLEVLTAEIESIEVERKALLAELEASGATYVP